MEVSEKNTMVRILGSRFQEGHQGICEEIQDSNLRETCPTNTGNEEAIHWGLCTKHDKGKELLSKRDNKRQMSQLTWR